MLNQTVLTGNLGADPEVFYPSEGKQIPMRGHPVFIAQHATAACCRGCIQKWHGIKKGKALSDREIQFLVELIMGWIEEQTKKDNLNSV